MLFNQKRLLFFYLTLFRLRRIIQRMNLLSDTYRLLEQCRKRQSIRQIAEGADLNYHWLGKFAQHTFPDPGVVKVQKLHEYLSARVSENRPAA